MRVAAVGHGCPLGKVTTDAKPDERHTVAIHVRALYRVVDDCLQGRIDRPNEILSREAQGSVSDFPHGWADPPRRCYTPGCARPQPKNRHVRPSPHRPSRRSRSVLWPPHQRRHEIAMQRVRLERHFNLDNRRVEEGSSLLETGCAPAPVFGQALILRTGRKYAGLVVAKGP